MGKYKSLGMFRSRKMGDAVRQTYDDMKLVQDKMRLKKLVESDPYFFVTAFAWTLDPESKAAPVKMFPTKAYLRWIFKRFINERIIVIAKSRKMMMTWSAVAYALWMAMTKVGRHIFFVSKKHDDSAELVSRANFIWQRLPQDFVSWYGEAEFKVSGFLKFLRNSSVIQGVSQESDALRQYSASLIVWDEVAFQDKASDVYAALRPTLQIGGQLIAISTFNGKGNLFYRIVYDKI